MQFNYIQENDQLKLTSYPDSLDKSIVNISSNRVNVISINQLSKGEGIVSKVIKESNNSNQVYNEYKNWEEEEESINSFNDLDFQSSLSEQLEEEYSNREENQLINEFPQTEVEILLEENDSSISKNKQTKKIKRGRPSKNAPRKGKHTRTAKDNGSKVIIKCCLNSIHESLEENIKKFIGNKRNRNDKKINGKLHHPTIKNYLTKGNNEKLSLFKSSIKTIYYNTIPKRVPDKIKNEKEKYCYNKEVLDNILTLEQEKTVQIKELNLKYEAEFQLYLEAFLNDKTFINANGIKLDLEKFKTLKDCFNEGEKSFSPKEKEDIKQYIYDIMVNNKKTRKKT